jgi:dipeptidyl aminopeptidase/acylaminoacyl peptidase
VLSATPSPTTDRIALGVTAGDHGEVRILDGRTLKLERAVKVPLGMVFVGQWRDDGKAFSIMISLADHPPDVYVVDAKTGDVKPLRDDKRPGLDGLAPIDVSIEHVKAFDGLSIPVNRYLPKGSEGKKLPTIVVFHGGPSSSYQVRWSPFGRFFLSLGYAVVEPNVRGSSGFGRAYEQADDKEKRADWLKDVETMNAWTKAQAWCDPDSVVVFGGSYGGYTTLMALTRQPTLWRAGVDVFGVADLKQFMRTTDAMIRAFVIDEFGDPDKDGALLDQFSPMRDVDKIVAPLFVYAGANDPRVPLSESDTIVKALRTRGVPVEYMVAANEGHSLDRRETKIEFMARVARFVEDALAAKR